MPEVFERSGRVQVPEIAYTALQNKMVPYLGLGVHLKFEVLGVEERVCDAFLIGGP